MQLLSILMVLIFVALPIPVIRSLKKLSKNNAQQEKLEELKELENVLSHLLADLEKSTSESLMKIENSIEEMDKVIDLAGEKTKNLEALLARTSVPSIPTMPSLSESSLSQIDEMEPSAVDTTPALPTCEGDPSLRRIQVIALARRGWSIPEIAKETGTGTGEVQLILSLNSPKNN
jgi:hypothetical protein